MTARRPSRGGLPQPYRLPGEVMSPFTDEQLEWLAADPTSQAWREMAATVAARVMAEHDAERAEADRRCRDPQVHDADCHCKSSTEEEKR